MKPDPAEPADQLNLLRQQLILAQVRIMELEDVRDSLAPRLEELERLLGEAQALADRKLNETSHLEKILREAQAQVGHLQAAQKLYAEAAAGHAKAMAESTAALAGRSETVARLQNELNELQSSRSWRWTAWLRPPGGKP
jgi:chromosome segregation ATPase